MFLPGLVSITFRKLSSQEIISLVVKGGLKGIEWGGDVHVPHGDVKTAEAVGRQTREAGLTVASYGSYYRVGEKQDFTFDQVRDTAQALGTHLIRVWAGGKGSADADAVFRQAVVEDALRIADIAAQANIRVAFEFHGGSLTDTTESAQQLMLRDADHPNLFSYWQPPRGWTQKEYESSLDTMMPNVAALHVFQWEDDGTRLPMAEGVKRWSPLLERVAQAKKDEVIPALIEFVCNDDPEAFLADAEVLKGLV